MITPMLRPDVFGALATHAGDALYELCYVPEFGAVVRALRAYDGDPARWWADFTSRTAFTKPEDEVILGIYGVAACFSAEPDGTPVLPFDPTTGVLRPDVWQRWLDLDPVRMAPRHADALRSLRAVWIDAGHSRRVLPRHRGAGFPGGAGRGAGARGPGPLRAVRRRHARRHRLPLPAGPGVARAPARPLTQYPPIGPGVPSRDAADPAPSRGEIITALHTALEGSPRCWPPALGGSDATGPHRRVLRRRPGRRRGGGAPSRPRSRPSIARSRSCRRSPDRWRLADPTWHGNAQEFLSLRDADPAHFIDLVVQEPTGGERFLEAERHGTAQVLFDRAGILTPLALDRDALQTRIDARLAVLRERFPLFQTLVTRAVRRGFVAEAAVAYQDHTYRPLIELLRIRHCPQRFDFGARYLDRDLPPALRAQVEALALPGLARRGGGVQGPCAGAVRRDDWPSCPRG